MNDILASLAADEEDEATLQLLAATYDEEEDRGIEVERYE